MGNLKDLKVLIRGAGEMASGVAHVLRTSGLKVAMTEVDDSGVPVDIDTPEQALEFLQDGQ